MSRSSARRRLSVAPSIPATFAVSMGVATLLLSVCSARVAAQSRDDDVSSPIYERPWNHVAMKGKLYFNTEQGPGVHEFDPAPRPGRPRGRVRTLLSGRPSLGSMRAAQDRVYFELSAEREPGFLFKGLDEPIIRVPSNLRPPLLAKQVGGALCIEGVESGASQPVWHPLRCLEPAELYGKVGPFWDPVVAAGRLFWAGRDDSVWTSDGTPGGARLVKTFGDGLLTLAARGDDLMIGYDAWASADPPELWKLGPSDDAPQFIGNFPLKDYGGLAQARGLLFFRGSDTAHGEELWRTDGTAAGTFMVADVAPGTVGSVPGELTVLDGIVYFRAAGPQGYELWRSDGTAAGTWIVRDINPRGNSFPDELMVAGGRLYFVATDLLLGEELHQSDGTAGGTRIIDLNWLPRRGAVVWSQTVVDDDLYFWGYDGTWPASLWRMRGNSLESILSYDQQQPIRIDGAIGDWRSEYQTPALADVVGDVAAGDPIDWKSAAVSASGDVAFLRYETAAPVDFVQEAARYQAFFDADHNEGTGFRGDDPAFTVGAEYLLQGDALLRYTGSGRDWRWEPAAKATVAWVGSNVELSVDTTPLAGPRIIGSRMLLRADNPEVDDYSR